MKINITKKEYKLLLEMLYLSDWMMNAHNVDDRNPEHETLRKKLLAHYKEMDAQDIIEYSETSDDFYETKEYEQLIHQKYITPYDDETFWDALIDRLAERDAVSEIGMEKYLSMEGIERIMKVEEYIERYTNEFEQHGLDHVKIECGDLVKS